MLSTLHSASQVSYFFSFLIVSHWYPEQTLTVISADKLQSLEITHETLKLLRRMHGCTHTAWRAAGHLQQAHSKYPRKVFYSINRHRKWYIHFSNITTNYKCSSLLKCLFFEKGPFFHPILGSHALLQVLKVYPCSILKRGGITYSSPHPSILSLRQTVNFILRPAAIFP